MRKAVLFVLFVVAILCSLGTAEAQVVDHWKTETECLAATDAPYYNPTASARPRLLGTDEVIYEYPTDACVEMVLPDRFGGRGWVRVKAGWQSVRLRESGEFRRMAKCDNEIFTISPKGLHQPVNPAEVAIGN